MYKKLLIVAAFVIAFSSVFGVTSVYASNNQTPDNSKSEDKDKDKDGETTTPPATTPNTPPPFIPTLPITTPIQDPIIIPTPEEKVKICHSRQPQPSQGHGHGAQGNPYGPKLIDVDQSAVVSEGHSGHDGPVYNNTSQDFWGDIIPPFDGYVGLNWSTEGQLIWDNNCQYPEVIIPTPEAIVDYDFVCDVPNKRAVITFTNTGDIAGSATLNGTNVPVAVDATVIKYIATPTGDVQITIEIDDVTVFDEAIDCGSGGQGGGDPDPIDETPIIPTPVTVPTPVIPTPVTVPTPVIPAGQGAVTDMAIKSLPYTASGAPQNTELIAALIVMFIAIAGLIIKKDYVKQI